MEGSVPCVKVVYGYDQYDVRFTFFFKLIHEKCTLSSGEGLLGSLVSVVSSK